MDEELQLNIFYIGLLAVIFLSLVFFIRTNLVDDKAYKDKFLSKDLALLHDSLNGDDSFAQVKIILTDEERIVYDTKEDCSFLVNLEKSYCGRYFNEEDKREILKGDIVSINNNELGVNVDAS